MPKIVLTEPMPLWEDELRILQPHATVDILRTTDHDIILNKAKDAEVLMVVYSKITADIIENAKPLKGIIKYGVGVDNIEVETATKSGIAVVNVPDYAIETVADLAMGLLLALSRRIALADRMMRGKSWGNYAAPPSALRGKDLRDKKLGLIGIGRIGKAVSERAKSFGMKLIAYDPYVSAELGKEMGVELLPMDEVLRNSDFVSLHSPLTKETRGMINSVSLSKMKDGVVIINTARGPLIDHKALLEGLRSGKVGGAGLDVLETEPPSENDPILNLDNVVLTPHIAWYTDEALRRLEMSAAQQAVELLARKMPVNCINAKSIRMIK